MTDLNLEYQHQTRFKSLEMMKLTENSNH